MSPLAYVAEEFTQALGKRPLLTVSDLQRRLDANEAKLFHGPGVAVFTWIEDYEGTGERVMHGGPVAGEMEPVMAALPVVEAWARDAGCTQIIWESGRKGWARMLRPHGYEEVAVSLRKVLA